MQRRRDRKQLGRGARLEMTPMIDVVFLLLVFFVVTIQPQDVLAKLDVSRPAPSPGTTPIVLLRIDVGRQGYVINGRQWALEEIRKNLSQLHESSPRTPLIIASTSDASHSQLVRLLDACAGIGIDNISLMSL